MTDTDSLTQQADRAEAERKRYSITQKVKLAGRKIQQTTATVPDDELGPPGTLAGGSARRIQAS